MRTREGVEALSAELAPMSHLEPIRRGIEPLERSMISVRDSVDELEPMIADLDRKIREIDPKLDQMQDSIEPIGDLAEKFPGNRRRSELIRYPHAPLRPPAAAAGCR